jgi:hypothetical protein
MNVVFIVTSYWAYGELLIALNFAKKIQTGGYDPYFVIPPSHEKIVKSSNIPYTILIPKAGRVNRILLEDIENKYHPTYIILSDFINYYFCEKHYGLGIDDLKVFKGKIGTFDNFDWALTKRKMDTYGFEAKTVAEVDIHRFGFRLAPCPIVNPLFATNNQEKNKFYYPLLEEFLPYNKINQRRYRQELNLPFNKQIILVTMATWQQTHKLYPHVISFVEAANKIYREILMSIAQDSVILYVGPSGFFDENNLPSNLMILKQLPPEVFEKYAMASDLFLTQNITSTTLAKLALSGIPAVMIKNSLYFTSQTKVDVTFPFRPTEPMKELLSQLDICYPYRMYPVGWYTFLEPVITNNPYMDVILEVELFDQVGAVNTIKDIMASEKAKDNFKNSALNYREILNRLDTPVQILDEMLKEKIPGSNR